MASGDTVTQVNPETGVPVRLRMALGTIGGVTYDRWYTWQRNALSWPEKRNKAMRGFVEMTTSDIWSVVSGSGPTPYRGEAEQDKPGWWWPCDDQPLTAASCPRACGTQPPGPPRY